MGDFPEPSASNNLKDFETILKDPNSINTTSLEFLENRAEEVKEESLSNRNTQLGNILNQRVDQREMLLKWLIMFSSISLCILLFIVQAQLFIRIFIKDYTVFNKNEFELLVTGVFGSFAGIIYVISTKLWDDKAYINKIN